MTILVTGANGFIGQYLCRALLERGDRVRALVRQGHKLGELASQVEVFEGDITQPETLQGVEEEIEAVIHLAACGHISAVTDEALATFVRVNVDGTRHVLERFVNREISRFVHVSSTAAVGLVREPLVNESHTPNPVSPYQKSKYESEVTALSFWRNFQVPVCVTRPCMAYGVGGEGEFHKHVKLMKKGLFPKVGFGANLTPLVHVHDVVAGLIGAMTCGQVGETYFLCGANSIPLDECRRLILQALNIRWRPYPYVPSWLMREASSALEYVAKRMGVTPIVTRGNIENTIFNRRFNIAKAGRDFGYDPKVEPAEGISETVRWFVSTGRI
jgi:nucleoside-diphosphate-sugar epimerase